MSASADVLALGDLVEQLRGDCVLGFDEGLRVGRLQVLDPAVGVRHLRAVVVVDHVALRHGGVGGILVDAPGERSELRDGRCCPLALAGPLGLDWSNRLTLSKIRKMTGACALVATGRPAFTAGSNVHWDRLEGSLVQTGNRLHHARFRHPARGVDDELELDHALDLLVKCVLRVLRTRDLERPRRTVVVGDDSRRRSLGVCPSRSGPRARSSRGLAAGASGRAPSARHPRFPLRISSAR